MKTLIIGGTGLISTSLTKQLLEKGEDVTLYNRGKREARFPEGAKTILGDRTDFPRFEEQMQEADEFDCVIDMIGYQPAEADSMIRAFKGRCGHFIFCSTVDVYNRPDNPYPIPENAKRESASDYGRKKTQMEDTLLEAGGSDFPVTVMRPAMTYGEGGTIVHTFGWTTTYLDRIKKGKPIVVHGDGHGLWVACHIDDVARGFIGAMGNPKSFGNAYNLTGEEALTWNTFAQGVAKAMNAPDPQIVHIPTDLLAKIAPKRAGITISNFTFPSLFDTSAARRDLGFAYTIPWVEGARRTINFLEAKDRILNSDDDPFDDRLISAWNRLSESMVSELEGLDN
ncbi:MAG: NAD-dependent epimerase/dehydratase family protein [Chthonomonadaceae bacterium]|nr:NAD-dependent epimerase/dehydratase family protein [Chthonomonadaceae bacterium]